MILGLRVLPITSYLALPSNIEAMARDELKCRILQVALLISPMATAMCKLDNLSFSRQGYSHPLQPIQL
jgi:hypothetical protein